MAETAAAPLAFEVASQYSSRVSFQIPTTALSAATPTQVTPQQVPAVGFLYGLVLEVTLTGTGGTTPAFTADAPFNVIQNINFRNAAGTNLIAPVDGYSLYLMNKFGAQTVPGFGPWADPKFGEQYSAVSPDAHFFLWLPLGLDAETAYGSVPALAANANYQVELTFASQASVTTSNPALSVAVNTTAMYFDLPASVNAAGAPQSQRPQGDATSIWQIEQPNISPGTQLVQSFNVGNVIRNHILVIRNAAGARIDVNGAPNLFELYLDNQPRFSFSRNLFENFMQRWYGLDGVKDAENGLDTGVWVFPYHTLLGSAAGDPANTRAQLLPTLNATLLQFRAQDFGSDVSKLQILTQSVTTQDPSYLFAK